MKMPKLPKTTQPKSKVAKPDQEQRSVSLRASSSRIVKKAEDSDDELWDEKKIDRKVIVLEKDQGQKSTTTVQMRNQRRPQPQEREVDKHEKNHQNQ